MLNLVQNPAGIPKGSGRMSGPCGVAELPYGSCDSGRDISVAAKDRLLSGHAHRSVITAGLVISKWQNPAFLCFRAALTKRPGFIRPVHIRCVGTD